MNNIAFILPDRTLYEQTTRVLKALHGDIRIEFSLLENAVKKTEELIAEGYEIFISRGRTAYLIRQAFPEHSVIDIPFTLLDIFQTIENSKIESKHIGVIAFSFMIQGLKYFATLLGTAITFYPLENEFDVENKVKKAIEDNVDYVVGGAVTGSVVKKYNLPFSVIESSPESILQAAQEAINISKAKQREQAKGNLFKIIMDYAYDGVIAINSDGIITVFNPIAERVTQVDASYAMGKNISEIWPELMLENVLTTGKEDLTQLHSINNEQFVCNKVPIRVNNEIVGAVTNFQNVTKLQKMEAKIRSRLYEKGHMASMRFSNIIGTSPQQIRAIELAKDFAGTDSSILIQGETGTGKEVFAQSIHNESIRRNGPFVAINCAALPEDILESELFGYVSGAFTGASQKGKAGLFEIAHKGTLFLDEIAEMKYVTQGKLLRVLQEKQVMRLGSDKVTPVDVRIIAATNKPLKALVGENEFRADLYYRLNVLQLKLYPLRERLEDVTALAEYFLKIHSGRMNRKTEFTKEALDDLKQYHWPGNVRELQNIIERILATLRTSEISPAFVQQHLNELNESNVQSKVQEDELEEIREALIFCRGKHTEAAKMLGISRSTLWRKLKQMNM